MMGIACIFHSSMVSLKYWKKTGVDQASSGTSQKSSPRIHAQVISGLHSVLQFCTLFLQEKSSHSLGVWKHLGRDSWPYGMGDGSGVAAFHLMIKVLAICHAEPQHLGLGVNEELDEVWSNREIPAGSLHTGFCCIPPTSISYLSICADAFVSVKDLDDFFWVMGRNVMVVDQQEPILIPNMTKFDDLLQGVGHLRQGDVGVVDIKEQTIRIPEGHG